MCVEGKCEEESNKNSKNEKLVKRKSAKKMKRKRVDVA